MERQAEIEHMRRMQREAHQEERKKRHSAINLNKGFFGRFAKGAHDLAELNPITLQKHKLAAIVIQKNTRRYLAKFIVAKVEQEQVRSGASGG